MNIDDDFYGRHHVSLLWVVGAFLVGAWIDNNTRFGWWVNNSATANRIFAVLKGAVILVAMTLFILFWYYFFTV